MLQIITKIYCKLIVAVELIYTKIFFFRSDRSQILLMMQTARQLKSYSYLNSLKEQKSYRVVAIIPFCDQVEVTKKAVQGLLSQGQCNINLKIILVNNNSKNPVTFAWLNKIKKNSQVQILDYPDEFNFSKINNFAVESLANNPPDYLWFLNNDVSFTESNSLQSFVNFIATTKNCGGLGCTLLYPDKETIQHLFISPGTKVAGAHPLKGTSWNKYHEWFEKPRPVAAVTGACLMLSFDKFINLSGFDENLPFSCQDLDLCLRLSESGFVNWSLSSIYLLHHESLSRKKSFYKKEINYFYNKWQSKLFSSVFWNTRFSTYSEQPILKLFPKRYPWKKII
jgi:O-antigen biosynthesis protein